MSTFLGIDIGTSGTKTLAIDPEGRILAEATELYPSYHPKPLWSEQDPDDWWRATVATVRAVVARAKLKPGDVRSIGLSGQMHGSVFLDKRDRVIRRAILWNDQRTAAECAEIEQRAGGRRQLIKLAANPALTGFTAPKILWLRNHEPRNFERTKKILLPKDDVRRRMTGTYATDVSDASGMLLLDVAKRTWSKPLLAKLELDEDLFGRCYESEEVTGVLTPVAAAELGLTTDCLVVGGAGDCAAGAVGNGIVSEGTLSTSIGTSGIMFVHSDKVEIDPAGRLHTFCHAVHGKWHMMGVSLSGGGCLQWFRNKLCQAEIESGKQTGVDPYDTLTIEAARRSPGQPGAHVPSLSLRRTHAACRPRRPGLFYRADVGSRPRPHGARRDGRRSLRDARQPVDHSRDGSAGAADSRFRRRLAQLAVAADSSRRVRPEGGDDQRRARPGLWRGAAGRGRGRSLSQRRRGLRRDDPRG